MDYLSFLKEKEIIDTNSGFDINLNNLNKNLFDWQKVIVKWSLKRGRSAMFADCGLGKTICQLDWANQVNKKEKEPILIFAPLAVANQTKQEGIKFGIDVTVCESSKDIVNGINITNYEKLHKFDPNDFIGVVLDESGILKNFSGKIRNQIIEKYGRIKYRLACTATPAPNDYTEIGNHSEFLGIMTRSQMLSTFFINDTGNTGTWRLKGHVKDNIFWKWLSSWSIMLTKPSDIGFDDEGFILPEIEYHQHIIKPKGNPEFGLFFEDAKTLNDRRKIRKETIEVRCKAAAEEINKTDDKWVIWCGLNDESKLLTESINNAKEVYGSQKDEIKEKRMLDFSNGKIKRLVTKPKIAGHGMNWQVCNNAGFVGLSDSWEQFYQAVRRIYRFGQTKKVNIHIWIEQREGLVLKNIQRKERQAQKMIKGMVYYMKELTKKQLITSKREIIEYNPNKKMELPSWMK